MLSLFALLLLSPSVWAGSSPSYTSNFAIMTDLSTIPSATPLGRKSISSTLHDCLSRGPGALSSARLSNSVSAVSGSSLKNRCLAVAIPGNGLAEQVFVGGFGNFLSVYNLVITARILLSWFPQAQSVGILQPVFAITDPYLNLFRGILPSLGGLDFSPILAFVALNFATGASASLGCEID